MSRYNPNEVKILQQGLRGHSENQYGDGIRLTPLSDPLSEGSPNAAEGREKSRGFAVTPLVGK